MWSAPEAPEYNQWALNPSAYQDLSHEEIDWALLAQQWIKMKETYPKDQVPPAPPPPPLGLRKGEAVEERIENEGGEAPMDMETREESLAEDVPQWGPFNNWNQWDSWNQWNAGGKVGPPPSGPPGAPPFSFGSDPQSVFNDGPVPGTIDYNHGNAEHFAQDDKVNQIGGRPGIPNHGRPTAKHPDGLHHYPPGHPGQHSGPGYWSGSGPPGGPCDGPIGQPHLGPYTKHNRNLWKHGVPRPPRDRFGRDEKPKEEEEEEETVEVLDAAKRRHLPAWIRDGLEKMEREKQKKLDREREMKEREERLQQQRLEEEEEAAAIAAGAMPKRSKFESDSESESENKGAISMETRKSRFQSMDSPGVSPERSSRGRSPSVEKGPPKSREEVMQEVMMKVRQMLTLILLEVTNEEMRNIAEETYGKARMKGRGGFSTPATDLQKSPALASLTGRLGLGIYEDSDEESGTDNEVDAARQANGGDSDEDLRETIRRRKQDFVKIEREIEADLAEDEEKERRLKGGDEEDDDDDDDGDEPDEDGRNEEKSGRGGGSKNQAQVEHQKAGSNLHLKEHGLQEPSGNADLATSKDGDAPNHHSASRGSPGRSPNRESSRRGSSTDGHESSTSRSSSSRVSSRRKSSKRSRDSRKKERKSKDKKRQRSSSREDEKKSKSRRGSADSSRRGKSRSRSRSDSGSRRDRKHRDSSRESSRVGSRADRLGHRDSYRDRGRDRDRYRDYRERDRDRDSRRRRGGSRFRRSNSRGRSRSRSRGSRSRRSDSRSRRSSSRIRSHRRSRSRSVESRRRRDSSGSRSVSPSKNRRRRSRSRSRSRSHHKISRRRHSSESSSERSSGKKSRHRRRD